MVPAVNCLLTRRFIKVAISLLLTLEQVTLIMGVQRRAHAKLSDKPPSPLVVPDISLGNITRSDFITARSTCPSIDQIRKKVTSQPMITVQQRSVRYEYVSGLIYSICVNNRNELEVRVKQY